MLLLPGRSAAQDRETFENFNGWITYNMDAEFTQKWGMIGDLSMRRSGPFDVPYAAFVRGGMTYALAPNAKIAVGASRSETWPYGKLPIAYRTPERRLWEQLQFSHNIGRFALVHRYRVEQRWQGHKESGSDDVTNWVKLGRFRYQMRASLPLKGATLEDHEFYLTAANELFISYGANVQYNIYDQWRSALSLGYRFSKKTRFEAGYMEQLSEKSNGRNLERNHTIIFTLLQSFTRRKAK